MNISCKNHSRKTQWEKGPFQQWWFCQETWAWGRVVQLAVTSLVDIVVCFPLWLQAVIQSDYTEVKTCCRLILGNPRSHRYVGRWDYWWKSLEYVWKNTLCQRQLSSRPEIDMKLLQKRCICLPLMRQQLQQPFANSSLSTEKTLRRSLPASRRQGWDVHNDTWKQVLNLVWTPNQTHFKRQSVVWELQFRIWHFPQLWITGSLFS